MSYQNEFIDLALQCGALQFGRFVLKSGRISPYFFNAGRFASGAALSGIGRAYAQAIAAAGIPFDVLFGPAYKGIPLVSTLAVAFARDFDRDLPYCFNRKEAKDHGEGGLLVGAPLEGRVVVVDDVITAGTAIRDVLALVSHHPAQVVAVVVGLDRQERGAGALSTIRELEQATGIPVISIIKLDDIMNYLRQQAHAFDDTLLDQIEQYRNEYGA